MTRAMPFGRREADANGPVRSSRKRLYCSISARISPKKSRLYRLTSPRAGAAAVEFAVVAPVIFLIVLGIFSFGMMMMTQNVLTAAAREGGRVAAMPDTDDPETVKNLVKDRLQRGGLEPNLVDIKVGPDPFENLTTGSEVSVTLTAKISDLVWFWPDYSSLERSFSSKMTYVRE